MSEGIENLVLEQLRLIRAGVGEVKGELSDIQGTLGDMRERLGNLETQYASVSRWLDRMDGGLQQIKRRLQLVEA